MTSITISSVSIAPGQPTAVPVGEPGRPPLANGGARGRPSCAPDGAADDELLRAAAAGDRQAFDALYRRHARWLVVRLSDRCADVGQVDEVLQDTFVAVWRGAARWDGRGDVPAWIWGIAYRRLLDSYRRRPRVTCALEELPEAEGPRTASAEEEALLGLEFGRLGLALAGLSPHLRVVVEATVLLGLSTSQASGLLGIPAGTVKTRMMRARVALRGQLTPVRAEATSVVSG